MAEITTSSIDSLTQAVKEASNLNILTNGVLANTVKQRFVPKGKKSCSFPVWGSVAMASYGEAEEITASAGLSVSAVEVTPTRHGLLEIVSDMSIYAGPADFVDSLSLKFSAAAIALQNTDIWALLAGFSTTATGASTSSALTEDIILNAFTQLQASGAKGPYYLPVTPIMASPLMKLYSTNTNIVGGDIRNAVTTRGELPQIFGVQPVLVTDVILGATTNTALYSVDAIGMAVNYLLNIETQRSAQRSSDLMVATSVYAVAEINDAYGITIPVKNAR